MPSQPLRSSSSNLLQRINTSDMTACRYNPLTRDGAVTEIPARDHGAVTEIPDSVSVYHTHSVRPNQCCSAVIQQIAAPLATVWSVVRRFDNPQAYKHFLTSCDLLVGDGNVGTLRQVHCVSGLPAETSTERLEILDEEKHVISFSVVGGEHRLANYRSVTTLHPAPAGDGTTVVVESYVVDIPLGNTREETRVFVDLIVKCNLQSLNNMSENLKQPN